MPVPSYAVRIDWSGNGLFSDANETVTTDVRDIEISRSLSEIHGGGTTIGTAVILLNNTSGKYSPDRGDSPLAGKMLPFRRAEVTVTYDGLTKPLYTGFVLAFEPTNDPGAGPADNRMTRVRLADRFRLLQHANITTGILADKKLHQVAETVLSDAGISAADRVLESSNDTATFALFTDAPAIQALNQIAEAGHGRQVIQADGRFALWNRYHNLGAADYKTLSSEMMEFRPSYDEEHIINAAAVKSNPRKKDTNLSVVARLQVPHELASGASTEFFLESFDPSQDSFVRAPADEMVSPVPTTDFTAGSTATGTDKTSLLSTTVTFFAETTKVRLFNKDTSTIFVSKFELRGKALRLQTPIVRQALDSVSQTTFLRRDFVLENDLIGQDLLAKDHAEFLVLDGKDPMTRATMRLRNQWPDLRDIDLGTVLLVSDSHTGVDERFFIEGIEHHIRDQGFSHDAEYRLRQFMDFDWLILDHDPNGRLNQRRVGF